jgi:hypothetical protein
LSGANSLSWDSQREHEIAALDAEREAVEVEIKTARRQRAQALGPYAKDVAAALEPASRTASTR